MTGGAGDASAHAVVARRSALCTNSTVQEVASVAGSAASGSTRTSETRKSAGNYAWSADNVAAQGDVGEYVARSFVNVRQTFSVEVVAWSAVGANVRVLRAGYAVRIAGCADATRNHDVEELVGVADRGAAGRPEEEVARETSEGVAGALLAVESVGRADDAGSGGVGEVAMTASSTESGWIAGEAVGHCAG